MHVVKAYGEAGGIVPPSLKYGIRSGEQQQNTSICLKGSKMTLIKPMQYTFSYFDIKCGTYSMFIWNYILHLKKSFSYSVVNVNLSMAIETYTFQYVLLMEVLTLSQLPSSSHCINTYSPCMCWAQNPLTMLFVEIPDFHSGSVDGYHITVCLHDNQRALHFHHHHHEPLILFFDKTKFKIFTVVNL